MKYFSLMGDADVEGMRISLPETPGRGDDIIIGVNLYSVTAIRYFANLSDVVIQVLNKNYL